MLATRFTEMFGVRHPIVQGGMRGIAMAELTAAVAKAGCLGFLSAHTHADPEGLRQEILKTRGLTTQPFGVNLTVLPNIVGRDYDAYAQIIIEMGVPFVETAGSNPAKFIDLFKRAGIKTIHKCPSSIRFALKAQELGADAVSIHGFECGGHPGEDDLPGLVLLPAAADKLKLPILSSGGVADGRGLAAILALGASGAVMGTRFLLTQESPLHPAVKARMVAATERDTRMIGRSVRDSSRVLHNRLVDEILEFERRGGADYHELFPLIGAERWIDASHRGDPEDGAYPLGLAVGLIHDLPTVDEVVKRIIAETTTVIQNRLALMVTG
ncbi:MAG: nitronate monooxygenase [Azonexus sp.]|jgi:nitronate monooxygenase|nr:nitronate monooxygenase [Azonexus sp.]